MGKKEDLPAPVVYDIETECGPEEVIGGWDNPAGMGFATAVAYDYAADHYSFFEGDEGLFSLCKILHGRLAVSFNGINFDSRVLLTNERVLNGTCMVAHPDLEYSWHEFDILLEYIKARFGIASVHEAEEKLGDKTIHNGSFNLDALASANFDKNKCGDGAFAPTLYRQQRFAELYEYNLLDVRLTRRLYDLINDTGTIIDRDGRVINIPTC